MVPKTTVEVADESRGEEDPAPDRQLEDNDDVQDVYANFDIPERVLETVASRDSQGRPWHVSGKAVLVDPVLTRAPPRPQRLA